MYMVAGRYVSVALSLRLPPLAVSQHSALWSSDFPRTLADPRLPVLLKPACIQGNTLAQDRLNAGKYTR